MRKLLATLGIYKTCGVVPQLQEGKRHSKNKHFYFFVIWKRGFKLNRANRIFGEFGLQKKIKLSKSGWTKFLFDTKIKKHTVLFIFSLKRTLQMCFGIFLETYFSKLHLFQQGRLFPAAVSAVVIFLI
jgi:hypothetical protein